MKRNSIFFGVMLALLLAGCGKQIENSVTDTVLGVEETTPTEKDKIEVPVSESLEEEKEEDGYTERNGVLIWDNGRNDGEQVDFSSWENINKEYILNKSINIYYTDTSFAGYTKEDATVAVVSSNGEWNFCIFDKSGYLVKVEDLLDAGVVANEEENMVSTVQPEVPEQQMKQSSIAETVSEAPTVETSVVESSKYTPEEAIAVYRAAMEAGGMTWDPSLKGVTSWGTGWIYLDKGYPEECASSNLESCAMGDSAGNSWTKYYLEVTGSDENAVYITEWTSN